MIFGIGGRLFVLFIVLGVSNQLFCMKRFKKQDDTMSSWSRCTKYGSSFVDKINQRIKELNDQKATMSEKDFCNEYVLLQDYCREMEQNLWSNITFDEIEKQKRYLIKPLGDEKKKKLKLSQVVWDHYIKESQGASCQESDVYNFNFNEAVTWYANLTKKRKDAQLKFAFEIFARRPKKNAFDN